MTNVLRRAPRLFSGEAIITELRAGNDRVFRVALVLRCVIVVLLGAAMLVLSRDRGVLVITSAVLLLLGSPVTWLMSKRYGMIPPWVMLGDVVVLGIYAAIEPEVRPLSMFVALAIISYASITLHRTAALTITVVASVSMMAAAAFRHDGSWVSSVISFPFAAFAIALPATLIAHSLSQARSSGSNQIAELDGILDRLTNPLTILELLDLDDPLSLTYIYTNPASNEHYEFDTRVGLTLAEVTPAAFDTIEHRGIGYKLSEAARNGTAFSVSDAHLTDPDGSKRVVCLHITPLPGHKIAIMTEDMTGLYAAQAELERQVYVDELTGLIRRVRLRDALIDAPVGSLVAVLDLDQFKEINDAFGHELGDELLVEVAKLLVETSQNCMVARFGGDEFGFLLTPGDTTAEQLGGRICDALSRPVVLPSGLTLQTSGSVGITVKARPQTSADELLRQADVAMYRAKRAHSGYEVYAVADDTSAPHRMMLLGEVRRAIRNTELVLYYQPIVDCSSGAIVRLEGLLRWDHPTLGLLPPAEFVELTELSNLNTDVVLHVLEIAITDLERWMLAGHPMPISINVAGTTLHDARLMDSIIGRIERAQLPVHLLGIELAERQLLLGSGHSVSSLQRLTAAGVWLSIDDFGTGTSSLSSLRHIPAHELKIDKSFVDDLRTGDSALIGTIVAMAHQLGLEVVAEGVEDEVTWRWLRAHGADNAQGYYFARPAPVAEIEVLLAAKAPLEGNGPTATGRMRPHGANPLQSVANAST